MSDGELSRSGEIEEQDALEWLKLSEYSYGWYDNFIVPMIYAAAIAMGFFLPLQFLFRSVDPNSYLLGCLGAFAGISLLWFFSYRRGWKDWSLDLVHTATIGPARIVLRDSTVLLENRVQATSLRLASIRNVSVHTRVVMIWITGSYSYFVPRSFFASAADENFFVGALRAQIDAAKGPVAT